ncbi:MAG TPA: hypothetical protein PLY87_00120 [Planctomycetaceae bacterium]|nr:hypothetical protein [Planctomycetaceae bacterium]HQZ63440.1 hypothetical protein [Planctomycetaceae bacterium]
MPPITADYAVLRILRSSLAQVTLQQIRFPSKHIPRMNFAAPHFFAQLLVLRTAHFGGLPDF